MADCATAAKELLDALEEKKCILIGTSWGGLTAIPLARFHPSYLEAMIITNPPIKPYAGLDSIKYKTIINIYKIFGAKKFVVGQTVKTLLGSQSIKAHPELRTQLIDSVLEFKSHSDMIKAAECVLIDREDVSESLEYVKVPSLVIAGSADGIAPPKQIRELIEGLDYFQFMVMENSGHVTPVDQPEKFMEEINKFLAKL
jgi:pimeloyl-ACP methyl ester carboxylesterase